MSTTADELIGVTDATVSVRAITRGPQGHYFGYYEKSPWNADATQLLCLEITPPEVPHTGAEVAGVMAMDADGGNARVVDQTRAWCWQQGCMLQWLGPRFDCEIIYNRLDGDRFVAVIQEVARGSQRVLPRPIYAVSPNGQIALSLNFARLAVTRPGYGYPALTDPGIDQPAPQDDGIFAMDLRTGETRLVVSLHDLAALRPHPTMTDARWHWVNHMQFNRSGTRFGFVHRWRWAIERRWYTRFVTADSDGGRLHILADDNMFSHYDWDGDDAVIAWARVADRGDHLYRFVDRTTTATILAGDKLVRDGHGSLSPDRRWLLTDTYPDESRRQHLMLVRLADERVFPLASFAAPGVEKPDLRCDLHPRWRRDGRAVCVDSRCTGIRQMYEVDVSSIVD